MKNIFLFLIISILSTQGFSQITERYISSDSPILITIKNKELRNKIDEGALGSFEIYKELSKEKKDLIGSFFNAILLNSDSTGISTEGNSYFTINFNDSVSVFQFIIPMGNKTIFDKTVEHYRGMKLTVDSPKGFKVLKKTYGGESIAYNDEVIIFSNIDIKYSYLREQSDKKFGYSDSTEEIITIEEAVEEVYEEEFVEETAVEETEIPLGGIMAEQAYKDSLENAIRASYLEGLFKKKSKLSGDLLAFTQKSFDMGFYMDYTKFYSMLTKSFGNELFGAPDVYSQLMRVMSSTYEETKLFGELIFEDNQVKLTTSFETDKETMASMERILDAKVNPDFIKYIKADSLVGLIASAVNVEAYAEFYSSTLDKTFESLDEPKLEMVKDAYDILSILFIDEDELYDLIKGDMLMTFNGIKTIK